MSTFRSKIRAAIANPSLQSALDKNAAQRLEARSRAYRGLPENFATLKQKAHAIRSEVIANLDRYLPAFIARVESNGITVHLARDAAQAREIVLNLARQHQARLISKSKTMMSEEIGLNPALEAAGYQVVTAENGLDALNKLGQHRFDLVVSDILMPKMDGFTLTREIRNNERTKNLPVVIVTSMESETDKRRGLEVGADAYLVKSSFDQKHLIETIEILLGQRSG